MEIYDSKPDTEKHIKNVRAFLGAFCGELALRADSHDRSKLNDPEKDIFDEFTPKLKNLDYGSDEYRECLSSMGIALKHHYEVNRHHPEHFENGIDDMNLIDLVEMFFDWYAATLRHENGNMFSSLGINKNRFNISNQLFNVFANTIKTFKESPVKSLKSD